ncbi:MAG: DUF1990 domain-containing protein [Deltaproteobacteria bacterium]|nr:MAG: DUF1990 domain-containing protein [Deltaproteobacteria bacterium]
MKEPLAPPTAPVLRLTRPTSAHVAGLVGASHNLPFSYPHPGGTKGPPPPGFLSDRQEQVVGRGRADFKALVEAICRWEMFDLSWVHLHDPEAPLVEGQVVAFSSWQLGLWVINLCRIVYLVDEQDAHGARFGFAYGTLPGHAVSGEELFEASFHAGSGEVRFAVAKFSRPIHPLVRLAGPVGRAVQDRFSRQAIARVAASVERARCQEIP